MKLIDEFKYALWEDTDGTASEVENKCEKIASEFAIEFAKWLAMFTEEFENGDIRYWNIDKWELKTYEELLGIYKKQQE